MRKKLIILIIAVLLLSLGIIAFYDKIRAEETGNVFYTDAPGKDGGQIDGEVFIIEKGDPEFNR